MVVIVSVCSGFDARKIWLSYFSYGCPILKRSCWIVIAWIWKRYACPVLGRGEDIAIKLYNRSYGDLYQLNGFRLTRSAWNARITIRNWLTVSRLLCLWFISAWCIASRFTIATWLVTVAIIIFRLLVFRLEV
mgnify:CR=1 FL=1